MLEGVGVLRSPGVGVACAVGVACPVGDGVGVCDATVGSGVAVEPCPTVGVGVPLGGTGVVAVGVGGGGTGVLVARGGKTPALVGEGGAVMPSERWGPVSPRGGGRVGNGWVSPGIRVGIKTTSAGRAPFSHTITPKMTTNRPSNRTATSVIMTKTGKRSSHQSTGCSVRTSLVSQTQLVLQDVRRRVLLCERQKGVEVQPTLRPQGDTPHAPGRGFYPLHPH